MAKHLPQPKPVLPQITFGLRKTQLHGLADTSVERLLDEGNILDAAEALAAMEEFVKTVRRDERYVQALRDEIAKHRGVYKTSSGAKLELCEAGVTYDYSHDDEWRQLQQEMELLNERKKAVELKLRSVPPGALWVNPETGELVQGALKKSTSTYRITLAK